MYLWWVHNCVIQCVYFVCMRNDSRYDLHAFCLSWLLFFMKRFSCRESTNILNNSHCFGLIVSYERPCSAHAGHFGTDRSLLTGHDALLLWQIARDLLRALSYKHDNTWHGLWWNSRRHWWGQFDNILIEFLLSEIVPCSNLNSTLDRQWR